MSFIDAQLYRTLKDGKEYEGLIPAYKGTQYNFDKETDNSNTYDTLRFMSERAMKFSYQMKGIAPLLKGNTKQETVNKIYRFLYSHFQYKLDGETQNLMSPSAAWHLRKTGFDCKTYSILASTILQNLGIPHSFRMVQQAGIMPGEWSHVYVIVPNGNTHFTIDATTHDNKEVSFTNKHDYTMKHKGLASPYVSALGCACQGTPIKSNGLGSPATLAITIRNFHSFLDVLEKQGISKEVTNRMLTIVRANVENGIDPNMSEVLKKALATTNGLGYINPVSSLTPVGYAPTMNVSVPTNNYYVPQMQSGFSTAVSGVQAAGTSAINNLSVAGIKVGDIASALTGNPLAVAGIALDLLKKVIPVDKTFGQVFANGFNLSCWGSSHTPAQIKDWLAVDLPLIYTNTIGKGITDYNLNMFVFSMCHIEQKARDHAAIMNKCSKTALTNYADAVKKAKDQVVTEVKKILPIEQLPSVATEGKQPFQLTWAGFNHDWKFTAERYKIVIPEPKPLPKNQATDSDGNPVAVKKSSSSTPLILGAGLLALKLLL